jgi:hypothetical protein
MTPCKPGILSSKAISKLVALGRFRTLLPPHPSPLPEGEGESPPVRPQIERYELADPWPRTPPLPKGEGWGEGERRPPILRSRASRLLPAKSQ